ncbi:MAG TPA: hypothetical protein VFX28_01560 [Methylomirabilota bacterium]|nr:hypothetical protein [Methylomirabilota bacterium]
MDHRLVVRFEPAGAETGWSYQVTALTEKKRLAYGDEILRAVGPNGEVAVTAPCDGEVAARLVTVGAVVAPGVPVLQVVSEALAPALDDVERFVDERIWNLAIATNAALKGLLGYMGASGQIASRTVPVRTELPTGDGVERLLAAVAAACRETPADAGDALEDADVVVLAEKPFAVAQKRLVPFSYVYDTDPKKLDRRARAKLLQKIAGEVAGPVEEEDLILADSYLEDPALGPMATVGAVDHNGLAAAAAAAIETATGKRVDVVISDTDTGIDVRQPIIGCITLGATPLGATRGLSVYECMRAACAAEFTRGARRRIPIVVCKPAYRCRKRPRIGEHRGYEGKLRLAMEGSVAFA